MPTGSATAGGKCVSGQDHLHLLDGLGHRPLARSVPASGGRPCCKGSWLTSPRSLLATACAPFFGPNRRHLAPPMG
jgi:hypothetical protein